MSYFCDTNTQQSFIIFYLLFGPYSLSTRIFFYISEVLFFKSKIKDESVLSQITCQLFHCGLEVDWLWLKETIWICTRNLHLVFTGAFYLWQGSWFIPKAIYSKLLEHDVYIIQTLLKYHTFKVAFLICRWRLAQTNQNFV